MHSQCVNTGQCQLVLHTEISVITYLSILLHWYITQVLITLYNATIYVNFNKTIAFDSLKLVKMFVIKIYIYILKYSAEAKKMWIYTSTPPYAFMA
jgi:hypothetical protein